MLGKLIKNEFKSTFRYYWIFFVAFFGLSVAFGIINTIMTSNNNINTVFQIFALLMAIIYFFSCFFISLAPVIFSALRFNKSVLGNEGYLTNTLPISTNKIVGSKLVVATVWFVATSIWSMLCLILSMSISSNFKDTLKGFKKLLGPVVDKLVDEPMLLIVIFIAFVISSLSVVLIGYASFSFSQIFNSHRGLKGSFIMIGIFVINIIVFSVFAINLLKPILGNNPSDSSITYWIFGVMGVNGILFGSISYFMTQWSLKKHLNLQ